MTDDATGSPEDSASSVGVVLPGDNRQVVPNATAAPFCWIGQIMTTWSNRDVTVGTGVLYGELHVITCAHNFMRNGPKGVVTAVESRFTMGLNAPPPGGPPPAAPSAGVAVDLERYQVPGKYSSAGGPPTAPPPGGVREDEVTRYLWDIAVARIHRISVPEPPGSSYFVLGPLPDGDVASRLIGYSGDRNPRGATQFDRNGPSTLGEDFLQYTMSSYEGDSGAPVFYPEPGRNLFHVIGVHVSGVPNAWNFAVPLTQDYIDLIGKLMESVDAGQGFRLG